MAALLAGLASGGGADKVWVDSVFSAYTYTGNGSTQTINNGIDLAGKGGMVWIKNRGVGSDAHNLYHTARGATKMLRTNGDTATYSATAALTAFTSSGFSLGPDSWVNGGASATYISWTFRNAAKFYDHSLVIKTAGSNATVDLSTLGTVGMVRVKSIATGSWYVWHRSLSAGKLLIGETTAAEATLGHITVVGMTLTLVNGVIADGTYHVEAYAHDPSADGLIQCGSYIGNSGSNVDITLGWEPQFVWFKNVNLAGSDWGIVDVSRGMSIASNSLALTSNTSAAETNYGAGSVQPAATGFRISASAGTYMNGTGNTIIYLAIRRPNKPPTSGTQVYNAIARTGTGTAATVTGVGFAPDLVYSKSRSSTFASSFYDRLRGANKEILTNSASAETTDVSSITSFQQDGVSLGADSSGNATVNLSGSYINHFFKRAAGVFDICCYTGTGVAHTEAHGLGVVPELMIVKKRTNLDANQGWLVYNSAIGNNAALFLHTNNASFAASGMWNLTDPTSSVFTIGSNAFGNSAGDQFVSYLFASKPGISCVKSFVGDGTTGRVIDCGFTAGARFILIKSTSSVGSWWIFDSVRGIVAAADPALQLNSTAAEITSADAVDPSGSGFIVNQEATCSLNATGVSYLVLAIA